MAETKFVLAEHENYQNEVKDLGLAPWSADALCTRHAYKTFLSMTTGESLQTIYPAERETTSTATKFSEQAARKLILVAGKSENPTEIHTRLMNWAGDNLRGLYTTLAPSKEEQSCYTMTRQVLEDTAKVFNFFVSEGAQLSKETYTEALTFCIKARKRLSIGALNDFGVMLKAMKVWDFRPRDWIEIIRPELFKSFAPRIQAVHEQLALRNAFSKYHENHGRILSILHVYGAEPRLSYEQAFEELMGFTHSEKRGGLNELADSRNISAAMLANRLVLIKRFLLSGEENSLFKADDLPVELERYRYFQRLRKRLLWQEKRTVRSVDDLEEQGLFYAMKLFEEDVFGVIVGKARTYDWEQMSKRIGNWLEQVSAAEQQMPTCVRELFPPTAEGIQKFTVREIVLKLAEETKSKYVSDQRTGVLLNDRLRAAVILLDDGKFAEAVAKINPYWHRSFGGAIARLQDVALMTDETLTAVSSTRTALIVEALLEGAATKAKEFSQSLMISENDVAKVQITDYSDTEFVRKVSAAMLLLSNLIRPRGLEGRWQGLNRGRVDAALLAEELVQQKSPQYLIRILLYAQMQGYSVREVVRKLKVPKFMEQSIFSQFTEVLRIVNPRPLSKTGRG